MPDYPLVLRDPRSQEHERHLTIRLNRPPKRGSVFSVDGVGIVRSRGARIVSGETVLYADLEESSDLPGSDPVA